MTSTHVDLVTGEIIDCAIDLHRRAGPGLLESFYERVMARDLEQRRLVVERQRDFSFAFEGISFEHALRVDLVVNHLVVVELKSCEIVLPVHKKQLLTYLRMLNLPVGVLINFGGETLKQGLHRVVHNYQPSVGTPRLRVNNPFNAGTAGKSSGRP